MFLYSKRINWKEKCPYPGFCTRLTRRRISRKSGRDTERLGTNTGISGSKLLLKPTNSEGICRYKFYLDEDLRRAVQEHFPQYCITVTSILKKLQVPRKVRFVQALYREGRFCEVRRIIFIRNRCVFQVCDPLRFRRSLCRYGHGKTEILQGTDESGQGTYLFPLILR